MEKDPESMKRDEPALSKQGIRYRIAHFTWPWFACTMSTGSLAVILAQTPNRFHGLQTIGTIFFILDVILFVGFTAAIATRFGLVRHTLLSSLHHPVESLFFGSYWVSASLIITCTQLYGVSSEGPWLVKALEVLFWTYGAIVLIVAVFQFYILFQEERLNVHDAMPAWIFPIYPLLVTGTMAGSILPTQPPESAFIMWHGAIMFQGLGWAVAFLIYGIYLQRLMSGALPSPPTRPGMYVSVGPAGYTSAAFISLGSRAPLVLPSDWFGVAGVSTGEVVKVIGVIAGLFVYLFAFWFFAISTVAVIVGIRRMSFTLNWWAFIFPNAGLTLATIQIANALDSPGIKGVTSAMTIALVMLWFMVAIAHIRALWKRDILWPGKDEDKDIEGMTWGRFALLTKPEEKVS